MKDHLTKSLEAFTKLLDSEEGKKSMNEFFTKQEFKKKQEIESYERFNKKCDAFKFQTFVDKVIAKYATKEYVERWWSRGRESQESLFWFLAGYAKHFGREASRKEYEAYGNTFTSVIYYKYGYFFNEMQGQGCAIEVVKGVELPDEEMITVSKNELTKHLKDLWLEYFIPGKYVEEIDFVNFIIKKISKQNE